jgi:hypothetical protein
MMNFKDKILTIPDHEYRELDGFSYSLLKAIDESGPQAMLESRQITSPALEFGSLVDILITSPERKNDVFWTKTLTKPTASLLELANALLIDLMVSDAVVKDLKEEQIMDKIKQLGLWTNMVDKEKIKAKYDTNLFWDYLAESLAAKGKIIVSQEILDAAESCAKTLTTHEYTRDLFTEKEGVEIMKQPSIVYKFKNTQGKARIDLLIVDHNTKTINIYDIKTGSVLPTKFEESFYHFKYYLQVISYMLATQSIVLANPEFSDYKIGNFKFLYLSKKLSDTPVIIEVPEAMLDSFANGWRTITSEKITGFLSLVDDYRYYRDNATYNVERIVIEKKGQLTISLL